MGSRPARAPRSDPEFESSHLADAKLDLVAHPDLAIQGILDRSRIDYLQLREFTFDKKLAHWLTKR
jgi:hypothetical protein